MIATIKNDNGFVQAYAVWSVVDEKGNPNAAGQYLYIVDIWIHESLRRTRSMKELFAMILTDKKSENVAGIYWENLKHKERPTPLYPRERLAKLARKEMSQCVQS